MHLVIDIGNTNIVFALIEQNLVINKWRISTDSKRTSDEYKLWLSNIFENFKTIEDIILGSVVPGITEEIKTACISLYKKKVFVMNEDLEILFPSEVVNKIEIGTDRLVNSLAAWYFYKMPSIIIDFGTATTFDVVDKRGIYVGGVICPGINLSLKTLYLAAARLPRITVTRPNKVIGNTTVLAMSSGIYYGYVGLIQYIIEKITFELGYKTKIILTGGLANLFSKDINKNCVVEKNLTIQGLSLAFQKHRGSLDAS